MTNEAAEDGKVLNQDAVETLRKAFKDLGRKVMLEVYVKEGVNEPYNQLSVKFVKELSEISDKIEVRVFSLDDTRAKEFGVSRSPTVLIEPDNYRIRYTGAPAGEEGRSFVQTLVMASRDESGLSAKSKKRLSELNEERHIQVFVTASCPYCPGEVINANRAAVERPELISSECVESGENIDLARKYNVGSVPQTVINEKTINIGLQAEELFVEGLITLEPQAVAEAPTTGEEVLGEFDVIIIGAGPAGLTAGIYAARSGMSAVILEKSVPGGQVAITPIVENWPGMTSVPGKQLIDMMVQHARSYTHIHEGEEVIEVKVGKRIEAITRNGKYVSDAVIFATGASRRRLGVPGEDRLYGKGVSYCATCDGFFYKDRDVVVVGGGNTALTDALYLDSLGARVTIVHRRDSFRAEKQLVESVQARKMNILWDSNVLEIQGEKGVEAVVVQNSKSGKSGRLKADGVFVAIGEVPASDLASSIGVRTDEAGFIVADRDTRTNIPRVYAAGDVAYGVRQIVTAAGAGAVAALSAFQDVSRAKRPHEVQ